MLPANAATGALAVLAVVLFAGTPPAHGSLHCATVADFVKINGLAAPTWSFFTASGASLVQSLEPRKSLEPSSLAPRPKSTAPA